MNGVACWPFADQSGVTLVSGAEKGPHHAWRRAGTRVSQNTVRSSLKRQTTRSAHTEQRRGDARWQMTEDVE